MKIKHGDTKVMGGGGTYAFAVLCAAEIQEWLFNELLDRVGAKRIEVEKAWSFKNMLWLVVSAFCRRRTSGDRQVKLRL